jgi:hypothetical protein
VSSWEPRDTRYAHRTRVATNRSIAGWVAVLLGVLILALGAGSASAAFRHTTIADAFGTDGTNATGWDVRTFAFDQDDDIFYGSVPSEIHGLKIVGPTIQTPLGPPFPFPAVNSNSNYAAMDVDNSGGPRDGYIYLAQGEDGLIRGWTDQGSPLANFPIDNQGFACGVSVDSEGFLWASNRTKESVERFDPATGGLIGSIGVGETGPPCSIEFDSVTDDLYVQTDEGPVFKYTKASGYAEFEQLAPTTSFGDRINANAAKGILYVSRSPGIEAVDTDTAERIEFITESNNNAGGVQVNESNDTLYQWNGNGGYVVEIPVSAVPEAITGPPVADNKVSGTVDNDGAGAITECFFDVGQDTGYEMPDVPCSPGPPYGPDAPVTAVLPGLTKEVTYHYRVVAKNANPGGINRGVDRTITPHWVPFLQTEDADDLTRTSAELHASFAGNGQATKYYFEWGPDTSYGTKSHTPPASVGSPNVSTPLAFVATGLQAGQTYHYRIVAESILGVSKGDDRTFTTLPAVRGVVTEPATGVTLTSATLHGKFEIDNEGGGDTDYYFEYGLTKAYGATTAPPPGHPAGAIPSTPSVAQPISVGKGQTYHFRIVVTNDLGTTFGADEEFKTPQEPSIGSITSSNVTATTADLIARINPNGSVSSYRFEYGTSPTYDHVVPIPDGSLGTGEDPVQVVEHIENLEAGATYHFRVVAENEWGESSSGDQTFAFFTANCPNAHVRQQSGAAYLPDCRAYELVSPRIAGPVQLFPGQGLGPIVNEFITHPLPSNTGQAIAPSRFAFWGGIGQIVGTNPPNITQDLYVSTRTVNGWETHYPGLSASDSLASGGTHCSALMDRCVNYDVKDPLELSEEDTGSNAPYVFDTGKNSVSVGRFPTTLEKVPGGDTFTGEGLASADYSHFGFASNDIAFAPGGLEAAPGSAYDNDTAADSVRIISKTPGGLDIAQDPGGCHNIEGLQRQCKDEFFRIQALSSDGSHILISNWAPPASGEFPGQQIFVDAFKRRDVHLTMRAGGLSYDLTQGHRANFVGMTRDGSEVFFTSDEAVTPDDTDASIDLFMWAEDTDSLTRLSTGSGGEAGNTDVCNVGWIDDCDIQTPNAVIEGQEENSEEIYTPDNWISENGEIFFYSPEQLDGELGFGNARNLYVYRGGRPQYVATFDAGNPAVRMQTAPDGAHMAFVTGTQITAYENAGSDQMYTYEPATDRITCVSCVPTGGLPAGDTIASMNGLFMSDDGRTFFSTRSALVPFDTNGLRDVYEYVEGRPQLISSGVANQDTWGGGLLIYPAMTTGLEGVSADGVDVYFSTFDTLVPEDENGEFIKFYDARTGGGFPFSPPPPPCKAADECHGGGSVGPAIPRVGTEAPLGNSGNVKPRKCKKGFVKKKGKCVKKKGKKKKRPKKQTTSKGSRANG